MFNKFFDFIDNRIVIRRACLFVAMWLEIETIMWAMNNAATVDAGQIAAVTGPVSLMFSAILAFYSQSRNGDV